MSLIDNFSPERLSSNIGESMRRRVAAIDQVAASLARADDLLNPRVVEPIDSAGHDDKANIYSLETYKHAGQSGSSQNVARVAAQAEIAEPTIETAEEQPSEVVQLSEHEADARRKLAQIHGNDVPMPDLPDITQEAA